MMLTLLLALQLGQTSGVKLYDESTYLGPVTRLKCVGSGIVCTLAETGSAMGVVSVTGGGGGGVPDSIPAVTFEATPDLTNERVLSNGTNTTIDLGTTGQAKVNFSGTIGDSSISDLATTKLTGTVTNAQLASSYSGIGSCPAGQYVTRTNANNAPTCEAPAGGGGSFVEVEVDFGAAGADTASLVVTGQAWVTSASKIQCAASLLATADRAEGAEDAVIEGLRVAFHSRVAGTGFTVVAAPQLGKAIGKFKVHCSGG